MTGKLRRAAVAAGSVAFAYLLCFAAMAAMVQWQLANEGTPNAFLAAAMFIAPASVLFFLRVRTGAAYFCNGVILAAVGFYAILITWGYIEPIRDALIVYARPLQVRGEWQMAAPSYLEILAATFTGFTRIGIIEVLFFYPGVLFAFIGSFFTNTLFWWWMVRRETKRERRAA